MDTIVISEASLQGKRTFYQVTIQNIVTTALLDTEANISVVSGKAFFRALPQTPQLLKICTQKVISDSGTNLGPKGQCHLTSRLGNKQ